jgi:hypothetical protein
MSLKIQDIRCNSGNVYENKADNRLFALIGDIPGMSMKTKLLSSELHARIEWNASCDSIRLAAVHGLRPRLRLPACRCLRIPRMSGWQVDHDAALEPLT